MPRIDAYLQHLIRYNAREVRLTSGQPAVFRFPTGDRNTNAPVDHGSLALLVQEIAPRNALMTLSRVGSAQFEYKGENGLSAVVNVEAGGPGHWIVRLVPAGEGAVGNAEAPPPDEKSAVPVPAPHDAAPTEKLQIPAGVRNTMVSAGPAEALRASPQPGQTTAASPTVASPIVASKPSGEPKINRYLRRLVQMGASDLHMSSEEVPFVRLHGEMRPIEQSHPRFKESEVREHLFEIITEKAKKDFHEKNDADFAHEIEGVARFRCNYFMDRKGMGAVFRQIPYKILTPEQLGLPKQVLDLCWLSKGLVVVTGPTGSGKSTTLATLVDYINQNRTDHIITIEDPIEFVHENKKCLVNQREVGIHTDSFKNALRAALREDPDIVLVGEMRDLETIAIAIETAETGHLVFGTLHTNTAPSTVDRIIDQFPGERQGQIRTMLSESLRGVIAQMLCKKTGGGRVAAYEILIATPAVSNLIREGKTYQLQSTMQTGKQYGMQTMNDHLLDMVKKRLVEPREAFIKSNDKATFRDLLAKNGITLTLTEEDNKGFS